jgi:hypothetical protein
MKESLNIKVRLIKIYVWEGGGRPQWQFKVARRRSLTEDVEEMATYWQDKGGSANEGGAFFS